MIGLFKDEDVHFVDTGRYGIFDEFDNKQAQMHWHPAEVELGRDVRDWATDITESERRLATEILRLFTQMDKLVTENYADRLIGLFQQQSVKRMLTTFASMEVIHTKAYALLLKTLGFPDSEFKVFLDYPEMRNKVESLTNTAMETDKDIALALAKFGAFTEGMVLFSSFAILLNFTRHGVLNGLGDIIRWSSKDENLHCEAIITLYHVYLEETGIKPEDLQSELHGMAEILVKLEDDFIDMAFSGVNSTEIRGLTKEEVKAFIRYLADWRLVNLGVSGLYGYFDLKNGGIANTAKDPLPWFAMLVSGEHRTNFFERKVADYAKGSGTGLWDWGFLG